MFNFMAKSMGVQHLSVSAVMMVKERDNVVVVDPRSKAIVRFTEQSFRSLLELDGMLVEEAAAVKSHSFQQFLDAMRRNGLIEELPPRGGAYNVARIKAILESIQGKPETVILNPPALPTININECCMFKCPHCYNDRNQHKTSEMDAETIISNIVVPLAEIGCANLMWSGGDPALTRDKTIYCTKAASMLGMSVATQAAEFSAEFVREFAQAGGRGIQFSLYSSPRHPEIDDRFRHRTGSWQMTVDNIIEARRNGLAVFINMILFPGNLKEIAETAEFVYNLGADTFRATIAVITGRAAANRHLLSVTDDQISALLREAVSLRDRYSSRMSVVTDISEYGNRTAVPYSFCSAGMTYMHVAEYKAFPCNFMMDDCFCLGSVRDETVDRIWRWSRRLQSFRTTEQIDTRCIACSRRESVQQACTDCKAVMWMRYGSYLDPRSVPCHAKRSTTHRRPKSHKMVP